MKIKFRVWDSISKRMHDWTTIRNNKFREFDLEHYTLMQFIGIKDKNGIDIYCGDKIESGIFGKGIIFYDEYSCGFKVKWLKNHNAIISHAKKSEIIGNIYENKK